MRQCLDEGTLQSYFDGELSTSLMESATAHLSSCVTCSAAARELEEENVLLSEAFALELDEAVPSERLRRRVDAAVAGIQVINPVDQTPRAVSGFFSSISNLFSFTPQRAFGYAALILVLAFGVIFGLAKLKTSTPAPVVATDKQPNTPVNVTPVSDNKGVPPQTVARNSEQPAKADRGTVSRAPRYVAAKLTPKAEPVKLLPGERSYLQTIAKLDSTIKEGKKNMRPTLQVEYERNLAVVDRAIAATRNAAKQNPRDPDAADFMFAAYQSKVDLLNTIADARVYNRTH
jgi:hypothetical protein